MAALTAGRTDDASAAVGLQVDAVTVRFPGQEHPALADVSLTHERGRVMALLGPSGCGKSTLLRAVAGLQPTDAGTIRFAGQDLTNVPTHRRDFALMFQDGQLFGHLTVEQNVMYGMHRRGIRGRQACQRALELLELVGMAGFEKRLPATLSGGQQQRVALARALAPKPRLLLLDEPLSALDRAMRERLASDLRDVLTSEGASALFVTHDHSEALAIADDIALMDAGGIVQTGEIRQVWQHPANAQVARFLGLTNTLDAQLSARLGLSGAVHATRPDGLVAATAQTATAQTEDAVCGQVERATMTPAGLLVRVNVDSMGEAEPVLLECSVTPGQALMRDDVVTVVARPEAAVRLRDEV